MTHCDDTRLLLGSYTIGGLEPDENARVDRHLQECAECREVHAALAPLPALMDLIEPRRAIDASPSPQLEGLIVASLPPRRPTTPHSRWRWIRRPELRIAAPSALAGVAFTVAVLAITGILSDPDAAKRQVTLAAPLADGQGRATAQLASTSTGTRVELDARLPALRDGEIYELWFVRSTGRVSAGTFTVDPDGRARVRLSTAARITGYERLGITREPDALDPARNGPSIVVAALRN